MIAFASLLLCLIAASFATLLPVDSNNPCKAYLNGTHIDLSNQFAWPVVLKHQPGNSPSGFYTYEWDCLGQRTSCGPNVAVCQTTGSNSIQFIAGGAASNALWQTDRFAVPSMLKISYPSTWLRQSTLTFTTVSAASQNASLQFVGEVVTEQYDFTATVGCGKYYSSCV